ncbi:MAG: rRNA maturation RNase YbeY [Synergistaceae bacterium]|jgi:probable rRNA maturation factor|nr:rRNA maturation RNase YbeY [Synergistaceae bacterium]
MKLEIELTGDADGDFPLPRDIVGEEIGTAVLSLLEGYELVTVTLSCVSEDEMRRLNLRYRDIDEPTDVLSFPLWEDGGEFRPPEGWRSLPLGDVVISPDFVRRGAAEANIGYNDEMARMVVHGTLHLVGFDHGDENAAAVMLDLQERTVKRVFSRAGKNNGAAPASLRFKGGLMSGWIPI